MVILVMPLMAGIIRPFLIFCGFVVKIVVVVDIAVNGVPKPWLALSTPLGGRRLQGLLNGLSAEVFWHDLRLLNRLSNRSWVAPELGRHFLLIVEALYWVAKIVAHFLVVLVVRLVHRLANTTVEFDLSEAGQRRKEQLWGEALRGHRQVKSQIVLQGLELLVWQAKLSHQRLLLLGNIFTVVEVVAQQIFSDPFRWIVDGLVLHFSFLLHGHLWLFDFAHQVRVFCGLFLNLFSPPLFLHLNPLIRICRKLSHRRTVDRCIRFFHLKFKLIDSNKKLPV